MADYTADAAAATDAMMEQWAGRIVDVKAMASIVGCSEQTVHNWVKAGAPVHRPGKPGIPIKLEAGRVFVWLIRRERDKAAARGSAGPSTNDYKKQKLKAEAELKEMQRDELQGKLIRIDVATGLLDRIVADARAKLLSIPVKIAPRVAAVTKTNKVQDVLEREIDRALEGLAAVDPADLVSEDLFATVGAAPEADGEPVGG